jgi:hypothetical protein
MGNIVVYLRQRFLRSLDDLAAVTRELLCPEVSRSGMGFTLGNEPAPRALPEASELRLDVLVARLVAAHDGKILPMLDEAQTLADAAPDLLATLRAVCCTGNKNISRRSSPAPPRRASSG